MKQQLTNFTIIVSGGSSRIGVAEEWPCFVDSAHDLKTGVSVCGERWTMTYLKACFMPATCISPKHASHGDMCYINTDTHGSQRRSRGEDREGFGNNGAWAQAQKDDDEGFAIGLK